MPANFNNQILFRSSQRPGLQLRLREDGPLPLVQRVIRFLGNRDTTHMQLKFDDVSICHPEIRDDVPVPLPRGVEEPVIQPDDLQPPRLQLSQGSVEVVQLVEI